MYLLTYRESHRLTRGCDEERWFGLDQSTPGKLQSPGIIILGSGDDKEN